MSQIELDQTREILALEAEIKAACAVIGKASLKLNRMGMEAKLSAWDWNRSGAIASLSPQGEVGVAIVPMNERPGATKAA